MAVSYTHLDVYKRQVYKDYEELLNDPQVDAVYIALTHKFHKEWILRSLEHHVPVLSEKPLVLTATDVDEIQEKVKKTNTLCTEALKTKFNTGYDQMCIRDRFLIIWNSSRNCV